MTAEIRAKIRELCQARAPGGTICPSEVARALAEDETAWRGLMPAIRSEAASLAASGEIVATQRGQPVDAVAAKGPIRLSLARRREQDA